jgi:hypothetical protein
VTSAARSPRRPSSSTIARSRLPVGVEGSQLSIRALTWAALGRGGTRVSFQPGTGGTAPLSGVATSPRRKRNFTSERSSATRHRSDSGASPREASDNKNAVTAPAARPSAPVPPSLAARHPRNDLAVFS